jgi:hypothetical protein
MNIDGIKNIRDDRAWKRKKCEGSFSMEFDFFVAVLVPPLSYARYGVG